MNGVQCLIFCLSLSLFLCFSLSLSSLFLCLSQCLSLVLSLSLPRSFSVSPSFFLCPSLVLSLSLPRSFSVSLSLFLSLSAHSLCLFLLTLSVSFCSLSLSLSANTHSLSFCLPSLSAHSCLFLSFFLLVCLFPVHSLSLCVSPSSIYSEPDSNPCTKDRKFMFLPTLLPPPSKAHSKFICLSISSSWIINNNIVVSF